MTDKFVVIINSLKVPKIKKILLHKMKFLVPNYSCLQNPWLGGYRPQIPVLSVLCPQLNLLNPPPGQNSWVRHWPVPQPVKNFPTCCATHTHTHTHTHRQDSQFVLQHCVTPLAACHKVCRKQQAVCVIQVHDIMQGSDSYVGSYRCNNRRQ